MYMCAQARCMIGAHDGKEHLMLNTACEPTIRQISAVSIIRVVRWTLEYPNFQIFEIIWIMKWNNNVASA